MLTDFLKHLLFCRYLFALIAAYSNWSADKKRDHLLDSLFGYR
jgi:hypothetical protein